jgi:hypothetical protein
MLEVYTTFIGGMMLFSTGLALSIDGVMVRDAARFFGI